MGRGGGGMKRSVEKKDRAGSRMKGFEIGRIQRWREIETGRDEKRQICGRGSGLRETS